jgi:hypothetical protein
MIIIADTVVLVGVIVVDIVATVRSGTDITIVTNI